MNDTAHPYLLPNAHMAWLACNYLLLDKIHNGNLISIEDDLGNHGDSEIFSLFPQTKTSPYHGFAVDVLRRIMDGDVCLSYLEAYVDQYVGSFSNRRGKNRLDESLIRTIWLPLWASRIDAGPMSACELGYHAIPVNQKPTLNECRDILAAIGAERRRTILGKQVRLEAAVNEFVASLGG